MGGWNFADTWEAVADTIPDAPAQRQGERVITWGEMDRRADGIARTILDSGTAETPTAEQDKVALYVHNCPEYLETVFACFKAGLVPVNTNYRYADAELTYLWDNADAIAVVFHGTFAERIEGIRDAVPGVRVWLWVDDGSGPCPDWAVPYETAAATPTERVQAPWGRSGDQILMLYTGGTTGMPKGVMWRQRDLFVAITSATVPTYGEEQDLDAVRALAAEPGRPVAMPACPLMHGTGWFMMLQNLSVGGLVVTLESRHLDIPELFDTIEAEGIQMIVIVGDAFAKPMLRALEAEPDRWDISSLFLMISSGVMWSEPVKQGLLTHNEGMFLMDAFSSSEALGMGQSVSSAGGTSGTAKFMLGANARVIDDAGNDVVAGSGDIGRVAVKGVTPIGYYKDESKSAATFVEIDGDRYSIPGDYAQVDADGGLVLLGRGSQCINTGGEKVYPEEVEEVLKEHPAIADAVAVGVPDDKFGEAITAMVEPLPGATVDEADVIAHVKAHLAHYKAPKRVVVIDTIGRAPNGKVDYKRLKGEAAEALGITG